MYKLKIKNNNNFEKNIKYYLNKIIKNIIGNTLSIFYLNFN